MSQKMNIQSVKIPAAAAMLSMAALAWAQIPAFPGAEGFGMNTVGGRGGNVYKVTNLKDDGSEGSLRHALSQPGPRTIVFDVSGTIMLERPLLVPDSTTLAGQTAPGDGICIAGYPVKLGSENIVRYLRFRLGSDNVTAAHADNFDALGAMESKNLIVDHCSVSWSIDECCSILGNHNSTLQWSIVSQSLVNAGHTKGNHGYGGNWGGSGASFHHNLLAHHTSRSPRLGPRHTTQLDERMDMRNNVMYNWGGNGCYGGEGMTVNIVNNYYKPGPGSPKGTRGERIAAIGIRTKEYCDNQPRYRPALHKWGQLFVEGNVNPAHPRVTADNWTYGIYNQIDTTYKATDGTWNDSIRQSIHLSRPMPYPATTTHSAEKAYEKVLNYAGASLHRDILDSIMVNDTREGLATFNSEGLSAGFINTPYDCLPTMGGLPVFPQLRSAAPAPDSDGDGMPDAWEKSKGLNPKDAADRNKLDASGYTMLEVYLAELVDSITKGQNEGGILTSERIYTSFE